MRTLTRTDTYTPHPLLKRNSINFGISVTLPSVKPAGGILIKATKYTAVRAFMIIEENYLGNLCLHQSFKNMPFVNKTGAHTTWILTHLDDLDDRTGFWCCAELHLVQTLGHCAEKFHYLALLSMKVTILHDSNINKSLFWIKIEIYKRFCYTFIMIYFMHG